MGRIECSSRMPERKNVAKFLNVMFVDRLQQSLVQFFHVAQPDYLQRQIIIKFSSKNKVAMSAASFINDVREYNCAAKNTFSCPSTSTASGVGYNVISIHQRFLQCKKKNPNLIHSASLFLMAKVLNYCTFPHLLYLMFFF